MVAQKEEYLTATMLMNLQKRVSSYRGSAMVVEDGIARGEVGLDANICPSRDKSISYATNVGQESV